MATIRTYDEIRTSMINTVKTSLPNISTRVGSVTRDVFINPSAYELGVLYRDLEEVDESQSPLTAQGENLVRLAKNFSIYRRGAAKAFGQVTFFTSTVPTTDITIPVNTVVTTKQDGNGNVYRFLTVQTGYMYSASASSYLNTDTGNWEITVAVEAEYSGIEYNVAANSVILMPIAITGITGVYNSEEFTGGVNEESYESLRSRLFGALGGLSIGTTDGYYSNVFNVTGVQDAKIVEPNDDEMTRKYAGGIDIYVKGIIQTEYSEIFTVSNTIAPDLIVTKQPVITENEGTIYSTELGLLTYGTDWTWLRDTSVLSYSNRGLDKIHWLRDLDVGSITVTYTYNSLITDAQRYIENQATHIIGADVLVRWASPVYINCEFSIRVASGYSATTVAANAEAAVSSLLSDYLLGQEVQQSAIISTINDVDGVDDIVSPLDVLEDADDEVDADVYGNLPIPSNRYAQANPTGIIATVI